MKTFELKLPLPNGETITVVREVEDDVAERIFGALRNPQAIRVTPFYSVTPEASDKQVAEFMLTLLVETVVSSTHFVERGIFGESAPAPIVTTNPFPEEPPAAEPLPRAEPEPAAPQPMAIGDTKAPPDTVAPEDHNEETK